MSHPVALLVDEVLRLAPRLKTIFMRSHPGLDLTDMEMTVLAAVVEAPRAPTVPQIGRSLGHPRQVVQRAANTLLGKGLIATMSNPDHKRAPLLVPTDQGRSIKHELDSDALQDAEALQAVIKTIDFERLGGELRELRHEIEAYIRDRSRPDEPE